MLDYSSKKERYESILKCGIGMGQTSIWQNTFVVRQFSYSGRNICSLKKEIIQTKIPHGKWGGRSHMMEGAIGYTIFRILFHSHWEDKLQRLSKGQRGCVMEGSREGLRLCLARKVQYLLKSFPEGKKKTASSCLYSTDMGIHGHFSQKKKKKKAKELAR